MKNEYIIDKRKAGDVACEMAVLAKGYTPEWKFDRENPDIGAVIALIFAKQMADSIDRLNDYPKRCRLEFVNMTGIGRMPPRPAHMQIVFKTVAGQDAVFVRKGMGIIADTQDAGQPRIVFELCESRYITSADISCILVSDSREMSTVRLYDAKGGCRTIDFGKIDLRYSDRKCFELFHPNLFLEGKRQIRMRLGNARLCQEVQEGDYSLFYMTDEGAVKIEDIRLEKDELVCELCGAAKEKRGGENEEDEEPLTEIMVVQNKPKAEDIFLEKIRVVGIGAMRTPEYIYSGGMGQQAERFFVFGGSLGLYSECYIGMDDYFRQKGARIGMTFELTFEEQLLGARPKEEEELKLIKRRSRVKMSETVADSYAERVIFEYMSPAGWKRLETENSRESAEMFAGEHSKKARLDFICPKDWEPSDQEGYRGRCLRIVLIKADFCYFQPCRHHLPVISDIKVEYSYEDNPQKPSKCQISDRYLCKEAAERNETIMAFSSSAVDEDALYIGLDSAPAAGPVSLYVKLDDVMDFPGIDAVFEYSSPNGFMPLAVEDNTYGGRMSGSLVFVPPKDFSTAVVGGVKACFLRIIDRNKTLHAMKGKKPVIRDMYMNAVEAVNIGRLPETEFYIEKPMADMHFTLGVDNIYGLSVWVNETENFSADEAEALLLSEPGNYRAQRDAAGAVKNFFVRWRETENFFTDNSGKADLNHSDGRVYVVDRSRGEIIFGDGVASRIPKAVNGAAFLAEIAVCQGAAGNVREHSVVMPLTSQSMIASIDNPEPAYGGADTETVARAVKRGMGYISSGRRLVTKRDYEEAARAYCEHVIKAKCVTDAAGNIELIVLMKDRDKSPLEFFQELKEYLAKYCELAMPKENIVIRRPVFVDLSVSLWLVIPESVDDFTLKGRIIQKLDEYLESVTGNDGNGWEIGELPTKDQILMKIGFLTEGAGITGIVLTARCSDESGPHETELEKLRQNPYVVVRSGAHTVNIRKEDYYACI